MNTLLSVYCKQCTQPNLTRPSLDALRPLGFGFDLGDGTGPAEESKRTKHVQGWSRQIGLGALFAIHTKLFSR